MLLVIQRAGPSLLESGASQVLESGGWDGSVSAYHSSSRAEEGGVVPPEVRKALSLPGQRVHVPSVRVETVLNNRGVCASFLPSPCPLPKAGQPST